MKTDRSCVVCGTSLLVSLVCMAGLLHVEYKLYTHEQMNSKHGKTTGDTQKRSSEEVGKRLDKNSVRESQQPDNQHRNRRDVQQINQSSSSTIDVMLRHHIRDELKIILKREVCAKDHKVCLQGPKGSRGRQGPRGPQGSKGNKGRRGRKGAPGRSGRKGSPGPIGKNGPRGLHGPNGPKGMKGDTGLRGPPGAPGPPGSKGPRGESADPIEAPTLFVPPKDVIFNKSDDARLKCVAKGNPPPKVTWTRPNSSLSPGRHVVDSHGFLSINQVTSNDGGVYTCTAESPLGKAMASAKLIVQVPPVFITKPKSSIAEENTNVTLNCGASGLPQPTISWTKSIGDLAKMRTTVLNNGSLVIINITKIDGGTYICTSENLLGKLTTHAQITVLPALSFTIKPPSLSKHNWGDSVVLNCQAANALELVWIKDNKPLGISTTVYSNGTLVISNLSPLDSGNYECIARNFHRSIKTPVKVQIKGHPKSCSEHKKGIPRTQSGNYVIDPDGKSGQSSFTVFCDMTDKGGVGVTVVSHDSEARTLVDGCAGSPGSCSQDIRYNGVTMAQLAKLTEISTNCEQFIKFECENDVVFLDSGGFAWWVSRDNVRQDYWGGATPGSKKCACGMTNTCQDKSQGCNCWNGGSGWRSDSGLLTDKSSLPVSQLRFGDTDDSQEQGYHTLGKLKCYG